MSKISYNGNNKSFSIPKKRYKIKKEVKVVFLAFLSLILLAAFLLSLNSSYSIRKDMKIVKYNEKGNINYQVYLKENSTYTEEYLNPGMEYVSNIIDNVLVKFNYQLHADDEINYEYDYKIKTNLVMTNPNEPDKILYTSEEILEEDIISDESSSINLMKDIEINYDEYNNIVNAYKNTHGVIVDSNLTVTMEITTNGNSENVKNALDSTNKLDIVIPLSEQTIGIDTPNESFDIASYLTDYDSVEVRNPILFIMSIGFLVLFIMTVLVLVRNIYVNFYKKDIYKSTIKKYLREYDRLIVTSKQPDINESTFDNKIRVMSIEELIDAHDTTGSPIIYYEVEPDEKSYFIIIDNSTIYKLTISRTYLESNNSK